MRAALLLALIVASPAAAEPTASDRYGAPTLRGEVSGPAGPALRTLNWPGKVAPRSARSP